MSIDGALPSQGAARQAATLGPVITDLEELTDVYPERFEVRTGCQVRRVTNHPPQDAPS